MTDSSEWQAIGNQRVRVEGDAERARIAAKKGSAGPRSARRPPRSNPDPQKGSTG